MSIPLIRGSDVGAFAWYDHGAVFTTTEYANLYTQLSNKSSESPDEYYDGTYDYGGNTYKARVRKDGYILAWLPYDTEAVWDFDYSANPPLSQRTIQEIMSVAGVSGFDFIKCYYYNFNYPSATKVRWFGKAIPYQFGENIMHFYFTVPASGVSIYYIGQHAYTYAYDGDSQASCTDEQHVSNSPLYQPFGTENDIKLFINTDHRAKANVYVNDQFFCGCIVSPWYYDQGFGTAKTVIVVFLS